MINYENLNDILVIPYRNFREKIKLTKQYKNKAFSIEVLENSLIISLKKCSGFYEL